jgi:hypothetical protein
MEFASFQLIENHYAPSIVSINYRSTPVWRQDRWDNGEYQEFIRKNGCGHCCAAMALRLNGIDNIDPHGEFTLCRQLWGAPVREREFPQDNLQSVSGITKIINHFGVKAEYFGIPDLAAAEKQFDAALKAGKQIIFWSHPTPEFPENPFSKHDHYVMAVGYMPDGKILVANSSRWAATTAQVVDMQTIMRALFIGADPIDMTWGERDHYINCSGYVVVG